MSRYGLLRRYAQSLGKMLKTVKPRDLALEGDGTYPTSSQDQLDLSRDRQIITLANSFRRTVIIERDNGNSFGFSLQSILIEKKNSPDQEPKRATFVSKVDDDSPADVAGIVPGDVIVAVDGEVVVDLRHSELISLIQKKSKMRVIVVFEDMVRKVELISLYLKLEKEIQKKQEELAVVEDEERKLLERVQHQPISTVTSSIESPDDSSSGFEDMAFSEIASSRVSIKSENLMISCSTRCYPRLVWVATPHRVSVLYQYSSSRWLATQSVPSQKPSLMQKYERFLEKNCPKCYKVHRMVVDGCKACVTDVKTYYIIRKDLNAGKISMADLSRKQLECYIQTRNELAQLIAIVVLAPLPFTVYVFAIAIIFFPRYILTRHFWSKDQKREYWADTMNKVASTHFAAIVAELPSQKHIDFPVPYEKLGDIKVTKLDDLSFTQVFHLSRVHRMFPLSGAKNLIWRAEALRHLDNLMIQELSIIDEMKPDELYTHMNIRRLNFDGLSESQIRDALKQWIKNSPSICVNPSLYLHAPVFLQYTKQLIEQIREQEKDHKI